MRFDPGARDPRWQQLGVLVLLLAFTAGCSSTSAPTASDARTIEPGPASAGQSPTLGSPNSPSAAASPGPADTASPFIETPSSSSESPGPAGSPGPSGSPWPSGSPAPSLTPDPNFVIPDWMPWPAQDPGSPSAIVSQGPHVPKIALTIDDGNFPDGCRQEFAYLSSNHIPATFFPDWIGVNKDRQLWRDIAAAGYPIGNHTLTHLNLSGPGVADHSVQRQLAEARERIEAIIRRPMLPVWRPPYGAYDGRDLRIAGQLGLHTMVLWSASDADSGPNSRPDGMIRSALRAQPGDILLSHCNTQTSADILPSIVQGLLAKGYTFVTIPDLLRPYGLGG